jgi:hypothetical protein
VRVAPGSTGSGHLLAAVEALPRSDAR